MRRRHYRAAQQPPAWRTVGDAESAAAVHQLADLLGVAPKPFAEGAPQPQAKTVALIEEADCIGCTLCIQACPVDAILGASKQMHTILTRECTGCALCIAPCPVDCIRMVPPPVTPDTWQPRYPVIPLVMK